MILNLTQHDSTPEQIALGVIEPTNKDYVRMLLTYKELPTKEEIKNNAKICKVSLCCFNDDWRCTVFDECFRKRA